MKETIWIPFSIRSQNQTFLRSEVIWMSLNVRYWTAALKRPSRSRMRCCVHIRRLRLQTFFTWTRSTMNMSHYISIIFSLLKSRIHRTSWSARVKKLRISNISESPRMEKMTGSAMTSLLLTRKQSMIKCSCTDSMAQTWSIRFRSITTGDRC